MRGLLGLAIALMVVMPGVALAQSPRQPIVELGVQLSEKTSGVGQFGQTLRLTVPLKRRIAIEATAGAANESTVDLRTLSGRNTSERGFSVHWRQTLFASGRLQIFGVLGGGRNSVETKVPLRIVKDRVEEDRSVESELVAHIGSAVQVELVRWLALRGDLLGIIGQHHSGVRGMVGAVITIPRFGADDQPVGSTPPPAEWRLVKPGRKVWVTTNTGSLVQGEVTAITNSNLNIREQDREVTIGLADVRLVEGRDSKKNGFLIGAVPGAVAGGLMGGALAAGCEYECDDTAGAILVLVVGGAAVGGFIGMMVDGLIPGRQTLFGGSTTVVTPVITPNRKSIDVAIRWR